MRSGIRLFPPACCHSWKGCHLTTPSFTRLRLAAALALIVVCAPVVLRAQVVVRPFGAITVPPLPLHMAEAIVERYRTGDFDGFYELMSTVRDFRTLFEVVAKKESSMSSANQFLTMLLEITNRAYAAFTSVSMEAGDRFIELGCERLRAQKATSFGRWWTMASVALMQGAGRLDRAERHLEHAMPWLPDEPSLTLARAVVEDQRTSPLAGDDIVAANRARDAMRFYEIALQSADTAAEAAVRLAYLHYRAGRVADALKVLEAPREPSKAVQVRYWTALIRGRVLEKLGRPEEAGRAYLEALELVPGAQSARVALLALKFVGGDRTSAERLIEDVVAPGNDVADPWWVYWQGDYRLFPQLIALLRRSS